MRIKEIMIQPVVTCPVESTLDHAARLMWEFYCGAIPVVGQEGRLAGMLTDRDICMGAYTQGRSLRDIPVSSVMTRLVVAVHTEELIEQAEHLMRESQVHRIPVLDDANRPVGIVSMNDLARLGARSHRAGVDREIVKTLAAICQPRATTRALPAQAPVSTA